MSEPAPEPVDPYRNLLTAVGWTCFGVFVVGAGVGNVWASAVAVIALCAMGYGIARLISQKP
jgi:uncharacterized membrane protein YjjB (DUF3815 family)